MKQLEKHILFFDFLENHYVSNDEVSKQHLSVIRESNFVKMSDKAIIKSNHSPLKIVLVNCQDQKTEVKATPFKISDDQTPITSLIEQTIFLRNPCMSLVNNLTILKKKLLKILFLLKNLLLKNLFLKKLRNL